MDGRSVVVGGRFLPFVSPCCCVYGKPELVREIHVAKTRDLRDYAKTEQTKRRNRKLVQTRERERHGKVRSETNNRRRPCCCR